MIKIQNVLVPTDFSEASDSALVYGRTLARMYHARLHVLHVVDDAVRFAGIEGYSLDLASVISGMIDDAEKRILTCLSEDDWRDPKTITEVRTGGPAAEIARYAKQAGMDLIVMGSHGRGFINGLLMGRVAERVVRLAPCPVLTVRTPEREFAVPEGPRNILVATDFGEASDTALTYGRALARSFGGRLHVLHVTSDAFLFTGPEAIGVDFAKEQARIDTAAMNQLNLILRDDDIRELQAVAMVRSGTSPAHEIAVYADAAKIDLIIIGTHGRGPMAHLLMGSVAERVVRTAPCPVLTVHHPEHEFVFQDELQVVARHGQAE